MTIAQSDRLFFVDLFSGGGGSARGYVDNGFTPFLAIDKEPSALFTYKLNFPRALTWETNIRELRSEDIQRVLPDVPLPLLIASPPCEPFTLANKKRQKKPLDRLYEDPVGHLMLDAIRLIGDLQPAFFVIENVLPSVDHGNKELLLDELARVGYDRVHVNIVQASSWGVPSHRLRVFISNLKFPYLNKPVVTVKQALQTLPDPRFPNDFDSHYYVSPPQAYVNKIPNVKTNHAIVYFKGAKQELKNYIRLNENAPAPVVMGQSRFIHPIEDRILTIREHARLMSFPDYHVFAGTTEERYNIVGEAVPPLITGIVSQYIKRELKKQGFLNA